MSILITTDKFKGSLTAAEACKIIADAIYTYNPALLTKCIPMADGGEGSLQLFISANQGSIRKIFVTNPLFKKTEASFGLTKDHQTAFIEMACASGLQLLLPHERNPMFTTTVGTGELLLESLRYHPKEVIIGIGGSATTDGGIGLASALGYRFIDKTGKDLLPVGSNLIKIHDIISANFNKFQNFPRIRVASDVNIPLYGPNGAAFLYAPQKGAGADEIRILDEGLQNLDFRVTQSLGFNSSSCQGAGAAGGLGYGLLVFAGARIESGFEIMADLTKLHEHIASSQLVITGEGKMDLQTLQGKTLAGICRKAELSKIPVIAYTGIVEDEIFLKKNLPISEIYSLSEDANSANDSIVNARNYLRTRVMETLPDIIHKLELEKKLFKYGRPQS